MTKFQVTHQKSSEQFWMDETGTKTQYNRLYRHEKLMEKSANKLFNSAIKLHDSLKSFKEEVEAICLEVYEQYQTDKALDTIGKGKGNFTWYNFDRTIKVEVSISERITFDDLGINNCKAILNEFLDENLDSKIEVLKDMVNDAFNTSRGNLDAKKVMNLLRYEGKIKNEKFQKAMDILKESIRRPSSKTYFRIWAKDSHGEFQNIDLNFSSIS